MIVFIADIIRFLANLFSIILLLRVLSSWLSADPYNPIVQFVARLTDPFLRIISRYIPTRFGMVDFSPIIALLIVSLGLSVILS